MSPTTTISLQAITQDFARTFKALDSCAPQGASKSRTYRPGIGPLTEADAIARSLAILRETERETYATASPRPYPGARQICDLVIPGTWAIEFKLIRPFGDNGNDAEHWSENILHPYPGNVSAIGDCIKLIRSSFTERKAVIVFGYEHTPPQVDLDIAIRAFESIAHNVAGPTYGFQLANHHRAAFDTLIHPIHQQGKIYSWEVLPL